MLDIRWIREDPEALDRALDRRGAAPASAELLRLDAERRSAVQKAQDAQTRRNAASKEIGQAKAQKEEERAQALMAEVASLKDTIKAAEEEERAATRALEDALAIIPNVPLEDVPVGPDESANCVIPVPTMETSWPNHTVRKVFMVGGNGLILNISYSPFSKCG